jgi:tetratricopeptide (TPR) repeat protein
MFFRRLLYFLLLILLPVLSAPPEALYSQENELEKANSINQKDVQLSRQGRYTKALHLAQQILEIRKKVLGSEHPDTAASLNNLAMLYYSLGDYPTRQAFEKFMDGISIIIFLSNKSSSSMNMHHSKPKSSMLFFYSAKIGCFQNSPRVELQSSFHIS